VLCNSLKRSKTLDFTEHRSTIETNKKGERKKRKMNMLNEERSMIKRNTKNNNKEALDDKKKICANHFLKSVKSVRSTGSINRCTNKESIMTLRRDK
jgi:hypothetical protein